MQRILEKPSTARLSMCLCLGCSISQFCLQTDKYFSQNRTHYGPTQNSIHYGLTQQYRLEPNFVEFSLVSMHNKGDFIMPQCLQTMFTHFISMMNLIKNHTICCMSQKWILGHNGQLLRPLLY